MTAPDPRLEEIEGRALRASGWPVRNVADEDRAYLLAELRKAQDKLARVEGLVSELAAEALASRNVAREIRKEPITNLIRQEIRDHEQAATIATNHATRIWTAVADATGGGQ